MLWNTQGLVDYHVNVRQPTELDNKFKNINALVKSQWSVFSSRNTIIDDLGMVTLKDPKNENPRIVCAANRYGDLVLVGIRHACDFMVGQALFLGVNLLHEYSELKCLGELTGQEQGFVDQYGTFHSRKSALEIATKNGQVLNDIGYNGPELFTEHMY